VLPLVEAGPVVTASMPTAQPKRRVRHKAVPTPRDEAQPAEAPKVVKPAVKKAKPRRSRSPVRAR
jgi:hypothetical protein